jgi:Ca2+-binding EF-hand superfamily protein
LGLSERGLELIDPNRDGSLSDEEFSQALRWLAVRQEGRLLATWRTVGPAWFELSDANADGRAVATELRELQLQLVNLDRDGDHLLTPFELPLLAALEIRRSDSRLSQLVPSGEGRAAADAADPGDWFAAMDSNGDGAVSYSEFLGTREQFDKFDADQDGFVLRREVYAAP